MIVGGEQIKHTGRVGVTGRKIARIGLAAQGIGCAHGIEHAAAMRFLGGFQADGKLGNICPELVHQRDLFDRVVVVAGDGHTMHGAILGDGAQGFGHVAGGFLAVTNTLLELLHGRLWRNALVPGDIGGLQIEVAILTLAGCVVAQGHQVHRSLADQFLDH